MKEVSAMVGAALLSAGAAFAADVDVKAPPVVPAFSWTGCYIGADVGGASARQHMSATPAGVNQHAVSGDVSGDATTGGAHAGCNYQFAPGWILGIEGDTDWAKLGGTATGPDLFADGTPAVAGGVSWGNTTGWAASVRGRLGYAVVSNTLVYGTGGVAGTRTNYAGLDVFTQGNPLATSFSDTRTGWVAGAGVDWAPWHNNWILRLEYLHYQFGSVSSTAAFNANQFTTFNFGDLKIDTVRAGLSYKF
jgi:outer membrane immunogenic protein